MLVELCNEINFDILDYFAEYPIKELYPEFKKLTNTQKLKYIKSIIFLYFENYNIDELSPKYIDCILFLTIKFIKIYENIDELKIKDIKHKDDILGKSIKYYYFEIIDEFLDSDIKINSVQLKNIPFDLYSDRHIDFFKKLLKHYNINDITNFYVPRLIIRDSEYKLFRLFRDSGYMIDVIYEYLDEYFYDIIHLLNEKDINHFANNIFPDECGTSIFTNDMKLMIYNQTNLYLYIRCIMESNEEFIFDDKLTFITQLSDHINGFPDIDCNCKNTLRNIVLLNIIVLIKYNYFPKYHIKQIKNIINNNLFEDNIKIFLNEMEETKYKHNIIDFSNENINKYLVYDYRYWNIAPINEKEILIQKYLEYKKVFMKDILNNIFYLVIFNY